MTSEISRRGRRGFLAKGGGIALGFVLAPGGLLHVVDARACGDGNDLDVNAWVHVSDSESTITIKCPTAEMGQGIYTSLPLLLAEELDADWRHVRVEQAPSDKAYINPDYNNVQGVGGSRSTQGYWSIMRLAGAQARLILIANAARSWGVPAAECSTVPSHVVHAPSGRRMSYMAVATLPDITLEAPPVTQKDLKAPGQWRLIGRDVARLDVPLKVNGSAKYGIDVHIHGMLYASILRPPVATCPHPLYGDGAENGPVKVDATEALKIEGVTRVVELPHGVAVVGTDYWATVKGKRALKVEWRTGSLASRYDSEAKKREWAAVADDRSQRGRTLDVIGVFDDAWKSAARTVSATYVTDHVHHACMEPFNATAWMLHNDLEVWAPTQGQTWAQESCGKVTGLAPDKVRVNTTFLGGGFGAKTEQLPNAEAAMLTRVMDKPVKVIWSREDDVKHGAYRPLSAQRMDAAVSADGRLTGWSHRLVADAVALRARRILWDRNPGMDGSVAVGMTQPYGIASKHHEYIHREGGIPVGYWNAVGNGYTIFAVESFVDEVAVQLGKDPLALRLELITDERGRKLLELVREMSGWERQRAGTEGARGGAEPLGSAKSSAEPTGSAKSSAEPTGSAKSSAEPTGSARGGAEPTGSARGGAEPTGSARGGAEERALGVAYNHGGRWNCQIAEVVEVSVDRGSGKIRVHKVWAAADPGTAIQPRHLRQQLETGIIWGMSAGLREHVTIRDGVVQQSNFHDYPVPRMDEIPDIEIRIVQGALGQSSGAGQIGVAPMAPAIANAVYRLTGARLRAMPFLPERVKQAIAESGTRTV